MKWQRLALDKAGEVRKEVDEAIRQFTHALQENDRSRIMKMRKAFEVRSDEIENFVLKNTDEERVILFEKQGLRLHRALSLAATAMPPENGESLIEEEVPVESKTPPTTKATKKILSSPKRKIIMKKPIKHSSSKTVPPTKPLYAWECHPESLPARSQRLEAFDTPAGRFQATPVPGIYANLDQSAPTESKPYVDITFVLTQAEADLLASMRRETKKGSASADAKSAHPPHYQPPTPSYSDSPFLNSSIPYIEATRVQAAIYRPPNNKGGRPATSASLSREEDSTTSDLTEEPIAHKCSRHSMKGGGDTIQQPIWHY